MQKDVSPLLHVNHLSFGDGPLQGPDLKVSPPLGLEAALVEKSKPVLL